jgi:hypothetical protein
MTVPSDHFAGIDLSKFALSPGATEEQIAAAEAAIGFRLPDDHREFLRMSNGATYNSVRFYPVDDTNPARDSGIVALHSVSRDVAEWPMLEVGSIGFGSADEGIGFLKADLAESKSPCPVYVFWHESGRYDLLTDSFREIVRETAALVPGAEYVPKWDRSLHYYKTDIEIRLGDRVKVRSLFLCELRWRNGTVRYVPGQSPPDPNMIDEDGNPYWEVRLDDGMEMCWIYLPNFRSHAGRSVRFVSRGDPGTNGPQPAQMLQ